MPDKGNHPRTKGNTKRSVPTKHEIKPPQIQGYPSVIWLSARIKITLQRNIMESRISSMYHPQFKKDYSTYEETGKYVHTQEKNLFLENPHIGINRRALKKLW